jgi:hypothetical protein
LKRFARPVLQAGDQVNHNRHPLPRVFPQRSLHWGLFRVPNDGIISAKSLGSDMLARRYPRGTAGRAVSVAPKKLAQTLILILGTFGLNFVGQGCHSRKSTDSPSMELTKIPAAAQGGRERIDTIAGRVRNARPRQQIVIYAHSGPRWVQPRPPSSDRDGDRWRRART